MARSAQSGEPEDDGTTISVRVPAEMAQQLVDRAKVEDAKVSQLVRRAIRILLRTPPTT